MQQQGPVEIDTNIDWANHTWEKPSKKIKTQEQMVCFGTTPQYNEYMTFICQLQMSVKSKSISDTIAKSEASTNQSIKQFNGLLKELSQLCEDTELLPKESARFGNPAFKTWYTNAMEVRLSLRKCLTLVERKGFL